MRLSSLRWRDAFDAMTTDRGYNTVKSFEESAAELASLDDLFDRAITSVLQRLVTNGMLRKEEQDSNE